MRNIFLLIKQFYSFFIFLFLEIICLIIVFRNNNYQQTSAINTSNKLTGFFYKEREKLFSFFYLGKVSDSLMAENARLKKQLGIKIKSNPLHDTSYTKEITIDSTHKTIYYSYLPAKVINNTIDQKINYLTLDKGSADGIKKNMGVISEKGIVGKVANVSEHYSIVTSLLSERFNISAMTPDGTVGKALWEGKNSQEILLTGIPQSVKLKAKDSIVTSSYSSIFPEGIMIGKVIKSNSATTYKVKTATDFSNIHFVYVIKETASEEQIKLEESIQE